MGAGAQLQYTARHNVWYNVVSKFLASSSTSRELNMLRAYRTVTYTYYFSLIAGMFDTVTVCYRSVFSTSTSIGSFLPPSFLLFCGGV